MLFQPWFAWSLAIGCVGWQLVARVGQLFDNMIYLGIWSTHAALVGVPAVAGLVAAQVLVTVRRGPQRLLLAAMVVMVFAPAAVVGAAWPPVGGLLGAAILLTVRAPLSWALLAAAGIADAAVGWSLSDQGNVIFTSRLYITTTVAVTLFAVTRLARLIQEADDARVEAARVEADAERLRLAGRLRAALGSPLANLIRSIRDISATPVLSRADVTSIAGIARQATADARRAVDGLVRLDVPRLPAPVAPSHDYLLAWWVSILIVVAFAGIAVNNVIWAGGATAGTWAVVIATVSVSGSLHLYHGTPRADGQPRWWPWTLSANVIVLFVAVATVGESLFIFLILVAGTVVIRFRAPWSWFILLLVTGTYLSLILLSMSPWNVWTSVYFAGAFANGVITVYALCNLPGVAKRLHETRAGLARTAIVAERLRLARDVHDLLGFHLLAIAIKTELATRVSKSDPNSARAQLAEVRHSAERALAEVRSIDDVAGEIIAADELLAARSMLEAAGIQVTIDTREAEFGEVDHLVGVIVREAATNTVRHSRARYCTIRISQRDDGAVDISITNDGADRAENTPEDLSTGMGLTSLTARAEAVGGWLTTMRDGATFSLTAQLPLRPGTRTAHALPVASAGRSG